MNAVIYIFRFIYHFRYWLLIVPSMAALIMWFATKHMSRTYEVKTTIYTGVVSGFNIESGDNIKQDWNTINNAMDNLSNIISAQTTLRKVSMRLFAQHMMYGSDESKNYISPSNYKELLRITPIEVQRLIDKESEENTLVNLYAYEQENSANYIYGLFHWHHPHYSYERLGELIVRRLGSSDMLEVSYSSNDPGIAYNTLKILNEEFLIQYEDLRFGETNNVIAYFEMELARIAAQLRSAEDSLTLYTVDKKVINYPEQTKYIAALGRDFALLYEEILLAYSGSGKLVEHLEKQIDEQAKALRNNGLFINKLNRISELTSKIATIESFKTDSVMNDPGMLQKLRDEQTNAEADVAALASKMSDMRYTKEGVASESVVAQWLSELIRHEKSKAELDVMEQRKLELDDQYAYFAPIGSTLNRKEREISFTEQSYLTTLNSLNAARLRQKNLQMTSATLKIINPPVFPVSAIPSKRKILVAGTFVGMAIFLLGLFMIIELLDRTLRDKLRGERLTGATIIGASPQTNKFQYRPYFATWNEMSIQNLSNSVQRYFKPHQNILNILSTEHGDGKSFIAEHLSEYWQSVGMTVRIVNVGVDFATDNREFYLASTLSDLCQIADEDVVIVVYPAMKSISVPAVLLQQASLNLVIARANRVWKDTDQLMYDKLSELSVDVPLFMFLTKADKLVVENFTGLLPPYTYLRKLSYRLYQLGLTSKDA